MFSKPTKIAKEVKRGEVKIKLFFRNFII